MSKGKKNRSESLSGSKRKRKRQSGDPIDSSPLKCDTCRCGLPDCNAAPIRSDDKCIQCAFCQDWVLLRCIWSPGDRPEAYELAYDFVQKAVGFSYGCPSCRTEALPAASSAGLTRVENKVDLIVDALLPPDLANAIPDASSSALSATTGAPRRKLYSNIVAAGSSSRATSAPFFNQFTQALRDTQREIAEEDLMERTLIVENCPESEDDSAASVALLQEINPTVSVESVTRVRPFRSQPRPNSDSSASSTSGPAVPRRPPILRIILRSANEKKTVMQSRMNLQKPEVASWMKGCFVRPSLPLDERCSRDRLYQVARARNGQAPDRKNRFIVWLNPYSEKYEFRQIVDGKMVRFATDQAPTEVELTGADAALASRRSSGPPPSGGVPMDQAPLNGR